MTVDHSQWNVLGFFHYHDYAVTLKASPEEDDYVIVKMCRDQQDDPVHADSVGQARDLFTFEVETIINYTSGSDVSLYMQQRARAASPQFISG